MRASEIGEYVFCHRAWWLHHVQGHSSANAQELAAGAAMHAGHGRLVGFASALRALAVFLAAAAAVYFIFSLIAAGPH